MIKIFTCFIIFLLLQSFSYAQTVNSIFQTRKRIELEHIIPEATYNSLDHTPSYNPYHRFRFRASGEMKFHRVGTFGGNIRPYLQDNEEAITYVNRFRTKRIIAISSNVATVASFTVFLVDNLKKMGVQENGPYSKGMLGAVIGTSLVTAIFATLSNGEIETAVGIYNQRPPLMGQKRRLSSVNWGMQTYSYRAQSRNYPTLDVAFKFW